MTRKYKSHVNEILNAFADDIEMGEVFEKKFDPDYFRHSDPEWPEPTLALFERCKLNPKYPGHWQAVLHAVANAIHSERTGRKVVWNEDKEDKLFRAVVRHRKENKKKGVKWSIEKICAELVQAAPYDKMTKETLHARFNIVLRRKRKEAKAKDASPSLRKDLKFFESN
jgi:hypothetical protein